MNFFNYLINIGVLDAQYSEIISTKTRFYNSLVVPAQTFFFFLVPNNSGPLKMLMEII